MHTEQLITRFHALGTFLHEQAALWREKPFTTPHLRWERTWPELSRWLRARPLAEADNPPDAHHLPHPFPTWAARAAQLTAVDALPDTPFKPLSNAFQVDVPGRKWQQINALAQRLHFQTPVQHWLDWCAGKGHLGRRLACDGTPLTCLEYDAALVADGQHLSNRLQLQAQHQQQDVLADSAADYLNATHTPVALHACGELHIRLLTLASAQGCRQLAIAPCCYNRIQHTDYQALSNEGRQSALRLSRDDLRLPLAETVTAGARVRRLRDISMARRLAFDVLQRELRGCDEYLPVPSLSTDWLEKPFADYCRDLAHLKQLPTPKAHHWSALEAHGWQRLAMVRNLEHVRGLFRRPMELWLVLDRALYLVEQGYQVRVGTFCEYTLTPRNLLIIAERY